MFSVLPIACCLLLGAGRSEFFYYAVDVPEGKIVRSTGRSRTAPDNNP